MTTKTDRMRTMDDPTKGDWAWTAQPEARRLVEELLIVFIDRCPGAAAFGERLTAQTGTHITDWVGVILTADTPETRDRLTAAGYIPRVTEFVDADIHYAFWNPASSTPDILLTESDRMSVGLRVDSVADFFAANRLPGVDQIQGEPLARARWAQAIEGERAALWVFERHGYDGYHLKFEIAEHRIAAVHHLERFRARTRCGDQSKAYEELDRAVHAASDELGDEWAADLFMHAEREFFIRSHPVARTQHARQALLGLGMANTDHAVYAASAAGLAGTLAIFETLGFESRERFEVNKADTALVIEHPINGDTVVVVTPTGDSPGVSGSRARLLGESILASGPAGIALRGEHSTLTELLGIESGGAAIAPAPIPSDRLETEEREGHLDGAFAGAIRNGSPLGPVLTLATRCDGGRSLDQIAWRGLA